MTYRILDLFCCAGGAAVGYARAGFKVYGVDKDPQPNYPYPLLVADAVGALRGLVFGSSLEFADPKTGETEALHLEDFHAVHASPPCQSYSHTRVFHSRAHADLVEPTREALVESGLLYVIENVKGSPLLNPLRLCGTEFDMRAADVDGVELKLIRHRLFESNVPLVGNGGCRHDRSVVTATVYGEGGGWTPEWRDNPDRMGGYIPHTSVAQELLGIDWMSKRELSQSVPPAMTEHIGVQLVAHLTDDGDEELDTESKGMVCF